MLPIAAAGMAGLVARATLVLSLALAVAWLARRGSARTLHMLWTTTFVLLLALPALSLLGPSWALPILPARDAGAGLSALAEATGEVSAAETPREMAGSPVLSGPAREIEGSNAEPGSFNVDPSTRQSRASAFSVPPSPAAIAFLIWALGSTAALISLAVGALRFRRLVRRASPLGDPAWVRQTDTIRRRLGVRAEVRLLSGENVPTPMTGGLWNPVILLPSAAENWTPDRRAVVLAHELVHVRRRDAFRQVVGRAVVAFYWFHPLSWLASRFATVASERSCDEEVLALGARPSEYARHLFSLASEIERRWRGAGTHHGETFAIGEQNHVHSEATSAAFFCDPYDCCDRSDGRSGNPGGLRQSGPERSGCTAIPAGRDDGSRGPAGREQRHARFRPGANTSGESEAGASAASNSGLTARTTGGFSAGPTACHAGGVGGRQPPGVRMQSRERGWSRSPRR